MGDVVNFNTWSVIKFPKFVAVRDDRRDKWTTLIFPDGQELDVENWNIRIHDNGIELLED